MFRFTISDVGAFLGKSPSTIRSWERKGLLKLPRVGNNRALTVEQVRALAAEAHRLGRISRARRMMISEALTSLGLLEMENE